MILAPMGKCQRQMWQDQLGSATNSGRSMPCLADLRKQRKPVVHLLYFDMSNFFLLNNQFTL